MRVWAGGFWFIYYIGNNNIPSTVLNCRTYAWFDFAYRVLARKLFQAYYVLFFRYDISLPLCLLLLFTEAGRGSKNWDIWAYRSTVINKVFHLDLARFIFAKLLVPINQSKEATHEIVNFYLIFLSQQNIYLQTIVLSGKLYQYHLSKQNNAAMFQDRSNQIEVRMKIYFVNCFPDAT